MQLTAKELKRLIREEFVRTKLQEGAMNQEEQVGQWAQTAHPHMGDPKGLMRSWGRTLIPYLAGEKDVDPTRFVRALGSVDPSQHKQWLKEALKMWLEKIKQPPTRPDGSAISDLIAYEWLSQYIPNELKAIEELVAQPEPEPAPAAQAPSVDDDREMASMFETSGLTKEDIKKIILEVLNEEE